MDRLQRILLALLAALDLGDVARDGVDRRQFGVGMVDMNEQIGKGPLDGLKIAELRARCIEPFDEQRDTLLKAIEDGVIGLRKPAPLELLDQRRKEPLELARRRMAGCCRRIHCTGERFDPAFQG